MSKHSDKVTDPVILELLEDQEDDVDDEAEWTAFIAGAWEWLQQDAIGRQVRADIWDAAVHDHHECEKEGMMNSADARAFNLLHTTLAHAGFTDPLGETADRPESIRPFHLVLQVEYLDILLTYPKPEEGYLTEPFRPLEYLMVKRSLGMSPPCPAPPLAPRKRGRPRKIQLPERPVNGPCTWSLTTGRAHEEAEPRRPLPPKRPRRAVFRASYEELQEEFLPEKK